ncbi:MAG: helical backbone metal receptor [Negativicutes bacterium]|nr:helical backbone metal receptor [Negativicutes bacterium]
MNDRRMAGPLLMAALAVALVAMTAGPRSDATVESDRIGCPATRIVSLSPAYTEIVFALGAGEQLLADTDYCDYPAVARDKPHVGGFYNPDIERIVALEPDAVLADRAFHQPVIARLRAAGIRVWDFDTGSLSDIAGTIDAIGRLTGREPAAAALLAGVDTARRPAAANRPRVFVQLQSQPLITAGRQSYIDDLISAAGGANVAGEKQRPYTVCDIEDLYRWQPDIYIIAGKPSSSDRAFVDRPAARDIRAVASGRVYWIDDDLIGRPGPRVYEALAEMRQIIGQTGGNSER